MKIRYLLAVIILFVLSRMAGAQVVPFFNGGAVASDPIIAVATDGVELNIGRATVTADRRYVTMDLDPQQTTLSNFRSFTFQSGGFGFVGGPGAAGGGGAKNGGAGAVRPRPNTLTPSIGTSPAAIGSTASASVLDKRGMTFISPLKP